MIEPTLPAPAGSTPERPAAADVAASPLRRMTLAIHHLFLDKAVEALSAAGCGPVYAEGGRSVHEVRRRRSPLWPGYRTYLSNNPLDLLHWSTAIEHEEALVRRLSGALDLGAPGRGLVVARPVTRHWPPSAGDTHPTFEVPTCRAMVYHDLAWITFILSLPGSGESLAKIALNLGAGVPMVSLGYGTGVRDRLGLLRITIPAEKELVHLIVPAHDTVGLINSIVEEARLDRPGRGFVYTRPVSSAVLDTHLRVGPQEHPATMDQIIAAIDRLTAGALWRRRFDPPHQQRHRSATATKRFRELSFVCPDVLTDEILSAATDAGAPGATISPVRRLRIGTGASGDTAATLNRCVMVLPAATLDAVVGTLLARDDFRSALEYLDTADCAFAFAHGA